MINRSAIKYSLKKLLPKKIFLVVIFLWRKFILHIITWVDTWRLKKFKHTKLINLTHREKSFLLYISPKNGFIDRHIFLYGIYEPFILDILKEHTKPGMTFIDIGANIGEHSMYVASLVGPRGKVHAFEPIPEIFKQLKKSSEANNFQSIIEAHNYALGNKDSKETLFVSENIGGSSLVNEEEGSREKIEVTIKKGDSLLLNLDTVDVIKIDVEGYEYEVLSGIQQTLLKHHPTIVLEFSGAFYHTHTEDHGMKILSLLKECGYTLQDIEDDMRVIDDFKKFNIDIYSKRIQTNLLCLHN